MLLKTCILSERRLVPYIIYRLCFSLILGDPEACLIILSFPSSSWFTLFTRSKIREPLGLGQQNTCTILCFWKWCIDLLFAEMIEVSFQIQNKGERIRVQVIVNFKLRIGNHMQNFEIWRQRGDGSALIDHVLLQRIEFSALEKCWDKVTLEVKAKTGCQLNSAIDGFICGRLCCNGEPPLAKGDHMLHFSVSIYPFSTFTIFFLVNLVLCASLVIEALLDRLVWQTCNNVKSIKLSAFFAWILPAEPVQNVYFKICDGSLGM